MSHPNRARGIRFQRDVSNFLVASGVPGVESRAQHGNQDRGDLVNVTGWAVELKDEQKINLAGALDEARVESINANCMWYAAIVKRRRRPIGESYAVLPLALFARLIAEHNPALEAANGSPSAPRLR